MSQQLTKKKKQPKNAFYFFMVHFKSQEENKGRRFSGGMKEVAEKAAPVWKEMAPRDKWMYEEEARKEKERDKYDLENKFTTQGKSYAQVNREEQRLKDEHRRMIQEIENTVRSLNYSSTLPSHTFHVIHVNYYCRQENGVYTPCEIAVAEFNFEDGVRNSYHTLINPGQIPLGYKFEADKLSADTHKIPVPPDEFDGETDYYKIFNNVKCFVKGMDINELYPYYTDPNCIDAVKSILSKLQEDLPHKVEFRIYPLTKLFYELRNACAAPLGSQGFPAFSIAEKELDRDVFNFTRGLSCSFHEDTDAIPHCSLSCVTRWSYLIMDHCCKDLGIELVPGRHCPKYADTQRHQRTPSRPASAMSSVLSHSSGSVHNTQKLDRPWNLVTSASTSISSDSKSLQPLRLPNTQSEAITLMDPPKFKENDFPAIGASSKPAGIIHDRDPIAVAGRGRAIAARLNNPICIGRGRGLVNLEEDFNEMTLE